MTSYEELVEKVKDKIDEEYSKNFNLRHGFNYGFRDGLYSLVTNVVVNDTENVEEIFLNNFEEYFSQVTLENDFSGNINMETVMRQAVVNHFTNVAQSYLVSNLKYEKEENENE